MKPFLILQLRPEDEASHNEYDAFLDAGGLTAEQTKRFRIEHQGIPDIKLHDYSGVIIGGGPYCVSDEVKPVEQNRFEKQLKQLLEQIIEEDFPYLGACYGLGILTRSLGGKVSKEKYSEITGPVTINLTSEGQNDPLFHNVAKEFRAFGGHKESTQELPPGTVLLAGSSTCPIQAIRHKKNIYATQFHAELDSEGLALRIDVYRHAGYFPAEDAEKLIELAHKEDVIEPEKFFKNFVDKYKKS